MMDESARLLTLQQQLENETDGKIKYFGLSVSETIRMCILNGSKKAEKVKSDFKVADKRFVINCLEQGRWNLNSFFRLQLGFGISNYMLSRNLEILRLSMHLPNPREVLLGMNLLFVI